MLILFNKKKKGKLKELRVYEKKIVKVFFGAKVSVCSSLTSNLGLHVQSLARALELIRNIAATGGHDDDVR